MLGAHDHTAWESKGGDAQLSRAWESRLGVPVGRLAKRVKLFDDLLALGGREGFDTIHARRLFAVVVLRDSSHGQILGCPRLH